MKQGLDTAMCPFRGPLPEGWRLERLRWLVRLVNRKTKLTERSYVGLEDIEAQTGRLLESSADATPQGPSNEFERGDVLFGKLRPYLGKVLKAESSGRCSAELLVLRAKGISPEFLAYVLLADESIKLIDSSTYGAKMPRAEWDFIGRLVLPVPPPGSQCVIASFLERRLRRVEGIIGRKQMLVDALRDRLRALVLAAVTRGLDPGSPMKASGVELLGLIPKHWETVPLGFVARIFNGSTPSREKPEFWTEATIPWLTSSKVHEGKVTAADQFVSQVAFRECHLPMVPKDSVLVAITGEGKTRGTAALLTLPATINQHIAAITPGRRLRSEYLWRYMSTLYWWLRFESSGGGSTKAAITCDFLKRVHIPLPPPAEQTQICEYLNRVEAREAGVMARVNQQVESLREYRQALISAAVTGKIDVSSMEAA